MLLNAETAAGLKLGTYMCTLVLYIYIHVDRCCMCVSLLILVSLYYAVKSFIKLARYTLSLPGAPPLLSRRITQDPLEKFFGLQKQRGRVNENPNSQEFYKEFPSTACGSGMLRECEGEL